MSFSYRRGLKKKKEIIQLKSIDQDTKIRLWNTLSIFIWSTMDNYLWISSDSTMNTFIRRLYYNHFNLPLDSINDNWGSTYNVLREQFFKGGYGYVYDFIEFIANNFREEPITPFMKACNMVLEKELSGYRFVDGIITETTSEIEINAIEEALKTPYTPVKTHLRKALEHMSDRDNPDYRNSIKESISAVESLCIKIVGNKMRSFQLLLDEIVKKVQLDRDLQQGFQKIYSWSSDKEGIRHALMNDPNLSFDDAKFMLVSCSAFVNYLVSKATKSGIEIK